MSAGRSSVPATLFASSLCIAIGSAAWLLHRTPAALADSPTCAGALEAASAGLFRLVPSAPAGLWLARASTALLPLAIAMVAALLQRVTRSWMVTAGAGLAIAAQPMVHPSISAFDPVLLLVVAGTALTIVVRRERRSLVVVGLTLTSAIVPRAGVPLAVMAAAYLAWANSKGHVKTMVRSTALAAALVIAAAFAAVWATPA